MEKEASLRPLRIAITGPESTGKSTLAEALAKHYHVGFVEEFARSYLARQSVADVMHHELNTIARGQRVQEILGLKKSKKLLFCDTDWIVLKVWSEEGFGQVFPLMDEWLISQPHDYYLLTSVDIPWVKDSFRKDGHRREYLFDRFESILKEHKLPYGIVRGQGKERLLNACKLMDQFLTKKGYEN